MKYLAALPLIIMSAQSVAGPKLYVFDCGSVRMDSMAMFNLREDESDVNELFVPCYLIKHDKGLLLWDAGLPREVADAEGPVPFEGGAMQYDRWIIDQLAAMGLAPADITYVAYSHLHFDHAGAANELTDSTVIMQQSEWDAAFDPERAFVDTSLIAGIKDARLKIIDGDYDVFGDGSVRMVYAPGHTSGHQSLLVMLDKTGPVMLSGDLYHTRANRELRRAPTFNVNAEQTLESMDKVEKLITATGATLWIEHDKALADTLRKAPEYYE